MGDLLLPGTIPSFNKTNKNHHRISTIVRKTKQFLQSLMLNALEIFDFKVFTFSQVLNIANAKRTKCGSRIRIEQIKKHQQSPRFKILFMHQRIELLIA